MIDAVQALRALGFHTLRLQGKTPAARGWRRAPPWDGTGGGGNVGIMTGRASSLWVLDLDDAAAVAWWEAERAARGVKTWEVRTGKGLHVYFRDTEGAPNWNRRAIAPGVVVDGRGEGGQVVAPPSIHPGTGRPYEWARGGPSSGLPLAPLPPWLIDMGAPRKPPPGEAGAAWEAPERRPEPLESPGAPGDGAHRAPPWEPPGARSEPDAAAAARYFRAAIERGAAAVAAAPEGARNDTLFKTARSLLGIEGAPAAEIAAALAAAAARAGLDSTETGRTLQSAAAAAAAGPLFRPQYRAPGAPWEGAPGPGEGAHGAPPWEPPGPGSGSGSGEGAPGAPWEGPPPRPPRAPISRTNAGAIVSNVFAYETTTTGEDGTTRRKVKTVAVPLPAVAARVRRALLGWPAAVGPPGSGALFIDTPGGLVWLGGPRALAAAAARFAVVEWAGGSHAPPSLFTGAAHCAPPRIIASSWEDVWAYVDGDPELARYEGAAPLLSHPPRPGWFYSAAAAARCERPPGAPPGEALRAFLGRFCVAGPAALASAAAAALSYAWGAPQGGAVPAIIWTAPGPGAGKTAAAEWAAGPWGPVLSANTAKRDDDELPKALVADSARSARAVLIDNLKGTGGSQTWERLITAPAIDARPAYGTPTTRVNDLIWNITANAPAVSRDIASRAIFVTLARPERPTPPPVLDDAARAAVRADMLDALRAGARFDTECPADCRFPAWWRAVALVACELAHVAPDAWWEAQRGAKGGADSDSAEADLFLRTLAALIAAEGHTGRRVWVANSLRDSIVAECQRARGDRISPKEAPRIVAAAAELAAAAGRLAPVSRSGDKRGARGLEWAGGPGKVHLYECEPAAIVRSVRAAINGGGAELLESPGPGSGEGAHGAAPPWGSLESSGAPPGEGEAPGPRFASWEPLESPAPAPGSGEGAHPAPRAPGAPPATLPQGWEVL